MEIPGVEQHMEPPQEVRKKKKISFPILIFVFAILVLAVAGYFFFQYQKTQQLLKNPTAAAQDEAKTLKEKVSKLILLPNGEDPTIATVSDKSKLQDQRFFAKAENGDKVLIYPRAGEAILYRPSINKIIVVGPVNLGQNNPSPQPTVAPTSSLIPTTVIIQATPTVIQNQNNPLPSVAP